MIKIGKINYANTLPVFYYFPEDRFSDEVCMIPQVPAVLNRMMREGLTDLGPISSFAYAENWENWLILPNLSVSTLGPVRSILLFTKKPLESYDEMVISLTNTSATSVNLLKILLHFFLKIPARYRTEAPILPEMLKTADGALLIGDDAIRESWNEGHKYVYDLGELWHRHTGHWMTFALWAVRKEVYLEQPDLLKRIYVGFLLSKERSKRELAPIVRHCQERIGGKFGYWSEYFHCLSHDFAEEQIAGLTTYYRLAAEMGLLPVQPKINIIREWQEKSVSGV